MKCTYCLEIENISDIYNAHQKSLSSNIIHKKNEIIWFCFISFVVVHHLYLLTHFFFIMYFWSFFSSFLPNFFVQCHNPSLLFFHMMTSHTCSTYTFCTYNSSVSFFVLSIIFGQYGGAVCIKYGSGTFTTCSFVGNTATNNGVRLFFGHLPSSKSSAFLQILYS